MAWLAFGGIVWACAAALAGPFGAASDPFEATASPEARRQAVQSIPLEKCDAAARAKIQGVLSNLTVFRRLPVRVTDCDPTLYLFLVRHPDVVVNIWEVLKLSTLRMQRTGPASFQLTEDEGSTAAVEFLYQDHDTHVVYVEGTYAGPLLKRSVKGRCLLVLKSGYVLETDGRYYITSRLDTFISVEPGGIELLTKTVQPMIGKVADHNFTQTVAFVGSLSRTAEVNREGVERLAAKLFRVQPEHRQRFAEVASSVAQRVATAATASPRPAALVARRDDETPAR